MKDLDGRCSLRAPDGLAASRGIRWLVISDARKINKSLRALIRLRLSSAWAARRRLGFQYGREAGDGQTLESADAASAREV